MNPTYNEHAVLFPDFAGCIAPQTSVTSGYLTRLQRASEGSDQSTGGRGHDVVESRCVRLQIRWRAAIEVVLGYPAVRAELNRLGFGGQVGAAEWSLHPLDPYLRSIHDVGHAGYCTGTLDATNSATVPPPSPVPPPQEPPLAEQASAPASNTVRAR